MADSLFKILDVDGPSIVVKFTLGERKQYMMLQWDGKVKIEDLIRFANPFRQPPVPTNIDPSYEGREGRIDNEPIPPPPTVPAPPPVPEVPQAPQPNS